MKKLNRRTIVKVIAVAIAISTVIRIGFMADKAKKENESKAREVAAMQLKEDSLKQKKMEIVNRMIDSCDAVFQINSKIESGSMDTSIDSMVKEFSRIKDSNLETYKLFDDIKINPEDKEYRDIQNLKNINERITGALSKSIKGLSSMKTQDFTDGAKTIKDIQAELKDLLNK